MKIFLQARVLGELCKIYDQALLRKMAISAGKFPIYEHLINSRTIPGCPGLLGDPLTIEIQRLVVCSRNFWKEIKPASSSSYTYEAHSRKYGSSILFH